MPDIVTIPTGEIISTSNGFLSTQWSITDYNPLNLYSYVSDRGQNSSLYNMAHGSGSGQINQIFSFSGSLSGNTTYDLRNFTGSIMGINMTGLFTKVKQIVIENRGTGDINLVTGSNMLINGLYGRPSNSLVIKPSSVLYRVDNSGCSVSALSNRYITLNASQSVSYKMVILGNE